MLDSLAELLGFSSTFAPYTSKQKKTLYSHTAKLCKYMAEQGIANIALVDRSARCMWVAIDMYWQLHYPAKEKPRMYFLNPEGFSELGATEDFRTIFKALMSHREEPLVLFDIAIHSGGIVSDYWSIKTSRVQRSEGCLF